MNKNLGKRLRAIIKQLLPIQEQAYEENEDAAHRHLTDAINRLYTARDWLETNLDEEAARQPKHPKKRPLPDEGKNHE